MPLGEGGRVEEHGRVAYSSIQGTSRARQDEHKESTRRAQGEGAAGDGWYSPGGEDTDRGRRGRTCQRRRPGAEYEPRPILVIRKEREVLIGDTLGSKDQSGGEGW